MTTIPTKTLNDGVNIPVYGFGTYLIPADGSTYKAVREALDLGIRHIDTAVAYFNEQEVGKAVRDSGIDRKDLFITSKLWLQDYGYEPATKAIETSLRKLDMDYMDLYLIHQPYGDVPGAWKAMKDAKAASKIRSIGVSNMTPKIWDHFIPSFETMPSVNQVEFNPYFQQKELRTRMDAANVALEGWAPLGQGNAELLSNAVITKIAQSHGKNAGQVVLRFEIQEGAIVFPKSTKVERMRSNMDIFDFELSESEMDAIRALDKGKPAFDHDAPGVADMLINAFDVHAND
ncbi:aldo/keto reductase [Alloscardovia criceti]|uniref:aldo/keto reductase n=1 Tax=Alloscardovia criceti TaxID=356828 RepID=UPI00037E9CD1|nr:aldo/keto reductase [Alloscardovia criceti]